MLTGLARVSTIVDEVEHHVDGVQGDCADPISRVFDVRRAEHRSDIPVRLGIIFDHPEVGKRYLESVDNIGDGIGQDNAQEGSV